MIDYKAAKQKAMADREGLDSAMEYGDAYMFYNSKARGNKRYDNEVIVLKKNGKIVSMTEYVIGTKDNGKPRHIKF